MPKKYLVVVAGPTAVGKTDVAIKLALHYNSEIISADSRQFYKEMSIGTAKPSPDQLAKVPHHFIGHLSIHHEYSAGKFEHDCIALLEKLFEKHKIVIMVGGSGLFTKAVLEGFDSFPGSNQAAIEKVKKLHESEGVKGLQNLLKKLDPDYYNNVDQNNPSRLMRALSVCISSGKKFSEFSKSAPKQRNFIPIKIGLTLDREILYSQIDKRVDEMVKHGLLEEVRELIHCQNNNALQTVGYAELFDFLEGKISFDEAVKKIKQHTRNFAKRQLTWFRKEKDITWFNPHDFNAIKLHIESRISNEIIL